MSKQDKETTVMGVHIALLRAVNVGGRRSIIMAELRDLLGKLGFTEVRSLLQTGNLIFRSKRRKVSELEAFLETEVAKRLNLQTDFLVRTREEWGRVVKNNPFPDEAERDAAHLIVMFLKRAPNAKDVEALREIITGPESVGVKDKQAYIVYPRGIGRSRLTNTLLEKKLGTRGTARNWNTVLKLASVAGD